MAIPLGSHTSQHAVPTRQVPAEVVDNARKHTANTATNHAEILRLCETIKTHADAASRRADLPPLVCSRSSSLATHRDVWRPFLLPMLTSYPPILWHCARRCPPTWVAAAVRLG
jgi:hypothetical protein